MHKILQYHLLYAFVANLKIVAIYALYPESFCDKNLAIRKVFAFCDSAVSYSMHSSTTLTRVHGLVGDLLVDDHLGRVPCVNGTLVVLVLDTASRFESAREINKILVYSLLLQSKNNSPALKKS